MGALEVRERSGFTATKHHCSWKIARICEVRIPLSGIGLLPGESFMVFFTLLREGEEVGRWPLDSPMEIKYLGEELELNNWLI
jgi:hypothetical protein